MTLGEYFATPETVLPQELIYGVARVHDAPLVPHQRVLFQFALALHAHLEHAGAGELLIAPTDVVLDDERALVVQPDASVVTTARASIVKDRIYGAPDIALEVLSPYPRIGSLEERVRWFARYGVREIWLYRQPDRALDVLTCADGLIASRATFTTGPIVSAVLPGFARSVLSIASYW
jgi:Uma2 family endonuclease